MSEANGAGVGGGNSGAAAGSSASSASSTPAAINVSTGGSAGAASPAPGAGGSQASTDWTAGLSEDVRGYAQNKGWKDPSSVLESYRNLEKLTGVPPERLLKLPEKADDPAWAEIQTKLGKPATADEYKLDLPGGEAGSEEFAKWAKGTFHELGLPKTTGEKLGAKWNEFAKSMVDKQRATLQAKFQESDSVLQKDWGVAFEQNMALTERALSTLGVSPEQRTAIAKALGPAESIKLFHKLATELGGEAKFESGAKNSNFGAMTPDAARSQIQALQNDPGFREKLLSNNTEVREQWDRLHKFGYPS